MLVIYETDFIYKVTLITKTAEQRLHCKLCLIHAKYCVRLFLLWELDECFGIYSNLTFIMFHFQWRTDFLYIESRGVTVKITHSLFFNMVLGSPFRYGTVCYVQRKKDYCQIK